MRLAAASSLATKMLLLNNRLHLRCHPQYSQLGSHTSRTISLAQTVTITARRGKSLWRLENPVQIQKTREGVSCQWMMRLRPGGLDRTITTKAVDSSRMKEVTTILNMRRKMDYCDKIP